MSNRARLVPPERVLILKPCCLGDVLMATRLAVVLRQAWPDAHIDWAVDGHSRPALLGNPDLSQLLDASHCIKGDLQLPSLIRLIREIRRHRYDVLLVPDRSPILSLVALISGVPLRVGLASGWRGFGYGRRVAVAKPDVEDRHEAEIYLDLARELGLMEENAPAPRARFVPSEADRKRATVVLGEARSVLAGAEGILGEAASGPEANGVGAKRPLVAIHPGGGVNPGMRLTEKRWPAERFAAVAAALVDRRGARLLLLGGPGDRPVVDALVAALPEAARGAALDLCGRLSLGEVAAMVERCGLYLGNDSGVAHLAAAVGCPVVVVFGPTDPGRYGPLEGEGLAVAPGDGDGPPEGLRAGAWAPEGRLDRMAESRAAEAVGVERVLDAIELLDR